MDTPTRTEFLLARITEDETQARTFTEHAGPDDTRGELLWPPKEPPEYPPYPSGVLHIGLNRVMAECEAKRRIVEQVSDVAWGGYAVRDVILELLALPYADHPEWRP